MCYERRIIQEETERVRLVRKRSVYKEYGLPSLFKYHSIHTVLKGTGEVTTENASYYSLPPNSFIVLKD